MKEVINNPKLAGFLATKREFFGEFNRYAIAAINTRGDNVQWFVWDAEKIDELTGLPSVIRQSPTYEIATADFKRPVNNTNYSESKIIG